MNFASRCAVRLAAMALLVGVGGCGPNDRSLDGLATLLVVVVAVAVAVGSLALVTLAGGVVQLARGKQSVGWGVANALVGLLALGSVGRLSTVISVAVATYAITAGFVAYRHLSDVGRPPGDV